MPDIVHRLTLQALPETVLAAITTSRGVRSWWTRDADIGPRRAEFRFPQYGEAAVATAQVAVDTSAGRVSWAIDRCFHDDWLGTRIEFDLRALEGQTVVAFAHRGFAAETEHFAVCSTGWAYYLVSLKRYLELGQGLPAPDHDFVTLFTPALASA